MTERAFASNFTAPVLRTSLLIEVIPLQSGNRPRLPLLCRNLPHSGIIPETGFLSSRAVSFVQVDRTIYGAEPRAFSDPELKTLGSSQLWAGAKGGHGGRASAPPWVSLTAHLPREAQAPHISLLCSLGDPCPSHQTHSPLSLECQEAGESPSTGELFPGREDDFPSTPRSSLPSSPRIPDTVPSFLRFPLRILLSLTVSPPSKQRGGGPVPTGSTFDLDEALCAQRRKKHYLSPNTRLCIHGARINSRSSCSQWTPAGEKCPYTALARERTSGTNPLPRLCPLSSSDFAIPE